MIQPHDRFRGVIGVVGLPGAYGAAEPWRGSPDWLIGGAAPGVGDSDADQLPPSQNRYIPGWPPGSRYQPGIALMSKV